MPTNGYFPPWQPMFFFHQQDLDFAKSTNQHRKRAFEFKAEKFCKDLLLKTKRWHLLQTFCVLRIRHKIY
jgi:hypothetical protein